MHSASPMHLLRLLRNCILISLVLATHASARRQAWLSVDTNLPEATVWVDSVARGPASQVTIRIAPGSHRISLVPPEADTWLLPRPSREIVAEAGDSLVVYLPFPYVYQIHTSPFDASLWLGESVTGTLLGHTPLVMSLANPIRDTVTAVKPGYRSASAFPGDGVINRLFLTLEPDPASPSAEAIDRMLDPHRSRGRWIPYVATGWALASAGVAIHYKSKADKLYDRYRSTGDPTLRPQVRRNDVRSAFALGSLQVGIGVLAVKLIFY